MAGKLWGIARHPFPPLRYLCNNCSSTGYPGAFWSKDHSSLSKVSLG